MANENRLIDATPLIDECNECMNIEWNKSVYTTWAEAEEDFRDRLLDAPTVDAVEVVRCEECVHCYQLKVDENGYWQEVEKGGTHNLCRRNEETFDVRCEDFCSYGERKDNG